MQRRSGTATQRARRVWWSDAARIARQEMRARGLMVGPWIDDIAAQKRGVSVPDQVGRLVDEMREAGLSDETIRQVVIEPVLRIVGTRQQDGGPRAA
jgi:microsomal dipeptidase-like Zn-dependent dipeptidase